jgi:hypothetical protein
MLQLAKTAPRQKRLPNFSQSSLGDHNTNAKKLPKPWVRLTKLPRPYYAAQPYAFTLWRMQAKFTGVIALPLLDTPIEVAHTIFIIFNELREALCSS